MRNTRLANQIIITLVRSDFKVICPCCSSPLALKSAGLFYLNDFSPKAHDLYTQALDDIKEQRQDLWHQRKHVSKSSMIGAKATNLGFVYEKLAPSLPSFPFQPNDCRTLGMPIDLMAFEGLAKHRRVDRILFCDIKTGHARLTERQKNIQNVIAKKRVEFEVFK